MTDQRVSDESTSQSNLLRPAEAAAVLRVAPRSLARMADRGEISVIRLPSGRRRYRRDEIEEIVAGAGQAHTLRARSGATA